MPVLVDTSAWVEFFNDRPSPEAQAVTDLLEGADEPCTCGIIVTEVLQGLRRDRTRSEVHSLLTTITLLEPLALSTYVRAADLFRGLRSRGVTVRSTVDCIIATIADEWGASLLARDGDMTGILASGLLRIRPWPEPAET